MPPHVDGSGSVGDFSDLTLSAMARRASRLHPRYLPPLRSTVSPVYQLPGAAASTVRCALMSARSAKRPSVDPSGVKARRLRTLRRASLRMGFRSSVLS